MRVWVSCTKSTCEVELDERGVIVQAAPIVKRFVGQPFGNLRAWIAGWEPIVKRLREVKI
jgi:hypothetical protein